MNMRKHMLMLLKGACCGLGYNIMCMLVAVLSSNMEVL
jgi:hypothetical protein